MVQQATQEGKRSLCKNAHKKAILPGGHNLQNKITLKYVWTPFYLEQFDCEGEAIAPPLKKSKKPKRKRNVVL